MDSTPSRAQCIRSGGRQAASAQLALRIACGGKPMRARTAVQARGTKCCMRPRNTAQHAQYKPMCEGERCGVDCNGRASKARWPVFRAAARGRRLKSGQRERGYGGWSRPSRTFGADACSQCRGGTPAVFGTRAGCCRLQPRPSWSWIAQIGGSLWCNLSPRSCISRSRRQLSPFPSLRGATQHLPSANALARSARALPVRVSTVRRTGFFKRKAQSTVKARLCLSWGDSSIP